ncbi:MAG: amidohydrolase [Deltaproteobacteria bacterium]|nr:amidohydrolase [Deltaproteobacteria bacterium]
MAAERTQSSADAFALPWIISSDSHVIEPPDLWTRCAAGDDRLPQVVSEDDGDWWYVDGRKTMSFLGFQTGVRFDHDPAKLRTAASFDEVPNATYDPGAFLTENERDGIWGSVIYPTQGLVLYSIPDEEIVSKAFRIYNDWVAEFCSHDPARLKGLAMINLDDPKEAVAELQRCRKRGLVGALVTIRPPDWQPYRSDVFEDLWAAAVDLEMPLSLHVATDRADPRTDAYRLSVQEVPPSVFINKDYQIRAALCDLIFSKVFERFPDLRIGSIEHEICWIPFFLAQMDYTYTDRPPRGSEWHRFADPDLRPSDFFRKNCFVSFQEDPTGIRLRDIVGTEALLFGSDYPHTESTFPRTRELLAEMLKGVPADEVRQIVAGNAAALYGFELPE